MTYKIFLKNLSKISLFLFLILAISTITPNITFSNAWAGTQTECEKVASPSATNCNNQNEDGKGVCTFIAEVTSTNSPAKCEWQSLIPNSEGNAFEATICNLLSLITGTGGKAFASFAIISVGIGFFTGKVSWGLMIGVAAGIAAIFGAPSVVAAIAGGEAVNPESCKKAVAL